MTEKGDSRAPAMRMAGVWALCACAYMALASCGGMARDVEGVWESEEKVEDEEDGESRFSYVYAFDRESGRFTEIHQERLCYEDGEIRGWVWNGGSYRVEDGRLVLRFEEDEFDAWFTIDDEEMDEDLKDEMTESFVEAFREDCAGNAGRDVTLDIEKATRGRELRLRGDDTTFDFGYLGGMSVLDSLRCALAR